MSKTMYKKKAAFGSLLLSCCISIHLYAEFSFSTLQELQQYARTYPESIKIDNNDTSYPDFTSTYESKQPTFFQKIYDLFSPISRPHINAPYFKNLIADVTETLQKKQTAQNGKKTVHIPPNGTVVFWGSLFGSYHSLVRTLTELHAQKVLSDDLRIIQQDCYFVFLGDAINLSPYSLETLIVIFTLMKKNPDTVVYVTGQQETDGYWENFNTRVALKILAAPLMTPEDQSIPLSSNLKQLFKLLPQTLIIRRIPEEPGQAFYATHSMPDEEIVQLNEIEVVLLGENQFGMGKKSGLDFIGYSHGTAIWSLLSCPNVIYQKFFGFYYDSFAMFRMGEKLLSSTLTVFNQDVRTKKGFMQESFDILYAIPLKTTDDLKKIHAERPFELGSTMPLYGGSQLLGREISKGINASIHKFNQSDARSINVFIRNSIFDDQLIPRIARTNVKTLKNDYHIDYLLAPVGTSTLAAYLPNLTKDEMFVFFPFSGDAASRNPTLKNIIHLRASYAEEVHALIDYMITEYRSKRFAFFYQNDAYGKDIVEAAHNELKKRGITIWTDIPYQPEQTEFKTQVELLKKASPDAIGFFSTSAPTQEFISQVGTDFFMGVNLFGVSFLESAGLRIFLRLQGIPFTFSSVTPNPQDHSLPLVAEYQKEMNRLNSRYSNDSLEGYMATELFLQAMLNAKPKITCTASTCVVASDQKRSFMNYFEGLKNYNFKGLTLTFNPQTRSFTMPVWIETEEGMWIEYDTTTGQRSKKDIKIDDAHPTVLKTNGTATQ